MIRQASLLSLLAASVLVAGCATSPTGRSQLLLVSDSQAEQMGAAAFAQIKTETPVSNEGSSNRYVRCIADALIAELDPPLRDQPWEVLVFASEDKNAFAVPGRKIGVYEGMVDFTDTPDQLAAIVGHEVGHVIAKHSAERASQSMAASTGLQIVGSSGAVSGIGMQALGLATQYGVMLPFSRTHESEADQIGLDLVARAGFNPSAAPEFWDKMSAAREGPSGPEFTSTHPADATRKAKLTAQLKSARPLYEQARANGKRPNCRR